MKHFTDIDDFKKIELRGILSTAKNIKKNPKKYSSFLSNKSLGMIFEKQSTRTRLSFSIGMQKLGGQVIELQNDKLGFGSRESEKDILKVLSGYLDILMVRNDNHLKLKTFASYNFLPIINGLSNYSHPCQILSDIFTIEECLGNIENKKIAWIGDINNVLTSLIQAAELFKFKLNIFTPLLIQKKYPKLIKSKKLKYCKFYNDINLGIKNVDCVMTDAWVSMGEKKIDNKKKLFKKFQVSKEIMKKTNKNSIFMNCLPANRNEEVLDSVIDGKQSVVWQQAKNRLYVQQSILCHLLK